MHKDGHLVLAGIVGACEISEVNNNGGFYIFCSWK